jgi:hypothetical protein
MTVEEIQVMESEELKKKKLMLVMMSSGVAPIPPEEGIFDETFDETFE